jgi:hypothetical protein
VTRNGANVAKFTLCGCPAPAAMVFRPPYARTIERLLDGNHTGQQLFNSTPETLHQLLTNAPAGPGHLVIRRAPHLA